MKKEKKIESSAEQTGHIVSLLQAPEERAYDFCPKQFNEFIGQQALKEKLLIYAQAARLRNEPLDHVLLFGPPGLGKTTLAQIIATQMQVNIKICSGPMLERTGDLVAILSSLEDHDVLFIDEIHRMPIAIEEVLYTAMEEYRVDVIIGQGAGAQSISLPLKPFTLVGATTKSGLISAPLRSRFGINERLEYYATQDLATIVQQSAGHMQIPISSEAAQLIGACARGTPRIAKKILRRVRDIAQIAHNNDITTDVVHRALEFLGIDEQGLTTVDHKILSIIIDQYNGGPVGLESLAAIVGEESETIEEVYEPFLMRLGYLERTPRGRQIPAKKMLLIQQKRLGQQVIGE